MNNRDDFKDEGTLGGIKEQEKTSIGLDKESSAEAPVFRGKQSSVDPLSESQSKYYDSQKKLLDERTKIFEMLKWLIPLLLSIITLAFTFFIGLFAYRLSNFSEPIGYIKSDIENLKQNFDEYKQANNNALNKVDSSIGTLNTKFLK